MSNYIISQNGKPLVVRAFSYNGLLWDYGTNQVITDEARHSALSAEQRARFRQALKTGVTENVTLLFKRAKQLAFCHENKVVHGTKAMRLDKDGFLAHRRKWKEKFFNLAQIANNPLIRQCAVKEPSTLPLVLKVALNIHEFNPEEVRELAKKTDLLWSAGKKSLVAALAQHNLADKEKYTGGDSGADTAIDPIAFATQWYGITPTASLDHQVKFWGVAEPFIRFAAKRAKWRSTNIRTELQQLSLLDTPVSNPMNVSLWQRLLTRQMKKQYKAPRGVHAIAKTDLMLIYPKMDVVEKFAQEAGISINTSGNARLLSIAFEQNYARENENPVLARLCQELRFPEKTFDAGLATLQKASANDLIPQIYIDGSEFGAPEYEIVKLAKTDPLTLVVGAMTNCCAHIGGNKKKQGFVTAMVTHEEVGCYVVRMKDTKKPSVKFTVWLDEPDTQGNYNLVVNAWRDKDWNARNIKEKILEAVARHVQAADTKVKAVYVGKLGQTFNLPVCEDHGIKPRDETITMADTRILCFVGGRNIPRLGLGQAA